MQCIAKVSKYTTGKALRGATLMNQIGGSVRSHDSSGLLLIALRSPGEALGGSRECLVVQDVRI